jgi:hypothetical protein
VKGSQTAKRLFENLIEAAALEILMMTPPMGPTQIHVEAIHIKLLLMRWHMSSVCKYPQAIRQVSIIVSLRNVD